MVPGTRRHFLSCCGGALAVVAAGCSGDGESPSSEEPEFPDEADILTDLPTYTTRVETDLNQGERLLTTATGEDGDGLSRQPYVTDAEAADALQFRRAPPDADEALAFIREAAYDEQSVVYEELNVGACHEYALRDVELEQDGGVSVQFCEVMRDPSISCSVGDTHRQLTLVRIPIAYDEPPDRFGSGRGSGCRLPPGHPASPGGDDG